VPSWVLGETALRCEEEEVGGVDITRKGKATWVDARDQGDPKKKRVHKKTKPDRKTEFDVGLAYKRRRNSFCRGTPFGEIRMR